MDILESGGSLIEALQTAGGEIGWIIFNAITFLGNIEFYLLFFPFLFWCVGRKIGYRLGVFFLLNVLINAGLKNIFDAPRPYQVEDGLRDFEVTGTGMPSGHAQNGVALFGALATHGRNSRAYTIAFVIAGLIGFSRIYLGAHYPAQVIAGWLVGGLLLFLYYRTQGGIERAWQRIPKFGRLAICIVFPIVGALVISSIDSVTAMGACFGITVAGLLVDVPAVPRSWLGRLGQYLVGMVIVLGLYVGLKVIFPAEGEAYHYLFRFIRYGLIGAWVAIAPLFLSKIVPIK